MQYSCGHGTDVGRVRDHNEDNYIALPEKGLWVVADGMGGHAAGEVASAIAIECIPKKVAEGMSLSYAIESAHQAILEAGRKGDGIPGMGCTIVALQMVGCDYEIAWVGDSRAYLWSDALYRVTRDHSFVQQLIDSGAITEDDARVHPQRSVITQALGASDIKKVQVDTVNGSMAKGDRLLLCSDGLTGEVDDPAIASILHKNADPQKAAEYLIQTANTNGGSDNVTVVVIEAPDNAPCRKRKRDTVPMRAVGLSSGSSRNRPPLIKSLMRKTFVVFAVLLIAALCWLLFSHFQTKPAPVGGGSVMSAGPLPSTGGMGQVDGEETVDQIIERDLMAGPKAVLEVTNDVHIDAPEAPYPEVTSPEQDLHGAPFDEPANPPVEPGTETI